MCSLSKNCIIIIGIIPGPHEPPVNINNYLEPIIDDLIDLWNGISISSSDGTQCMRAALLAVAADLPAIRKVTQFLGHKADLGCTRCKFRAEREPHTAGACGRMSYFTPLRCEPRTHPEVVSQVLEYKQARRKVEAARIAQKNGVRYSQLLRLPYFDIVRMTTIDPMHTFLLGMVKRETALHLDMLSNSERKEFVRRLKSVKLPYDIGRLPSNIFDRDSLDGATADQWKTYITTCARPCMHKLIPSLPYKSLVLLSEIVSMISSPVMSFDDIDHLDRLLHEHHALFGRIYGKWAITVNYHMSLYIPDIISDFGPPNTFWCFSYERVNGILAGTPNSNRNIEVEVANRFLRDFSFNSTNLPDINVFDVPANLKELTATSMGGEKEIFPFPLTLFVLTALNPCPEERFEHQLVVDRGDVKDWPIEFHHPCQRNLKIRRSSHFSELSSFFEALYGTDFEYLRPRITKYGRCSVNGQTFSSDFNSTDRGSVVKAMFVDNANELCPYFGIMRYYFTATAVVCNEPKLHYLSYVTWLKLRSDNPEPLSKLYITSTDYYRDDRIISPRRFLCRCVLIPTRENGSSHFVSDLVK